MYVAFNELSVHGQIGQVTDALRSILRFRELARSRDAVLRCHRDLLGRPATGAVTLRDVVKCLPPADPVKRTFLAWVTRDGPFLDEDRDHEPGTWFEHDGELITDTMLAEAAHRTWLDGIRKIAATAVASLDGSDMVADSLVVERVEGNGSRTGVAVTNHVRGDRFDAWLAAREPPPAELDRSRDAGRGTMPVPSLLAGRLRCPEATAVSYRGR